MKIITIIPDPIQPLNVLLDFCIDRGIIDRYDFIIQKGRYHIGPLPETISKL